MMVIVIGILLVLRFVMILVVELFVYDVLREFFIEMINCIIGLL